MRRIVFICLFLWAILMGLKAQCPLPNTAFGHGELLQYELYFNWKFVWIKAGTATFATTKVTRNGQPAYRTSLITRTSKRLDRFFCMRDTLLGYSTEDNVPLYYRKGANEGGKYKVDEVFYSYPNGKPHLQQKYLNSKGKRTQTESNPMECVYDMVSMMQRARSMDANRFRVGDALYFKMADGDDIDQEKLVYRGKETIKMEGTKRRFRCLVFSFIEAGKDKKGRKEEKEIVRFFVSDDKNHFPARLDLYLKFGTAKAFLSSYTGVRNPVTSEVKK